MFEEHSRDESLLNKYLVQNGQATATGRHKAADRFHWGLPDQHVHIVKVATDGAPLRRNRRGDNREIDLLFKYQQAPYHTQVYALYYSGIWRHIIEIYQNELSHKRPWSNGARQTIPLIASALTEWHMSSNLPRKW